MYEVDFEIAPTPWDRDAYMIIAKGTGEVLGGIKWNAMTKEYQAYEAKNGHPTYAHSDKATAARWVANAARYKDFTVMTGSNFARTVWDNNGKLYGVMTRRHKDHEWTIATVQYATKLPDNGAEDMRAVDWLTRVHDKG